MSALATGTEAPSAPATSPGASASPSSAPPAAPNIQLSTPGDFIQLPRENLKPYGGSWHKMDELAKQGLEFGDYSEILKVAKQQNVPAEWLQQMIQYYQPPAPETPSAASIDVPRLVQAVKGEFQATLDARDQQAQQRQQEQEHQATVKANYAKEEQFADGLLKDIGIAPDNPHAEMFRSHVLNTTYRLTLDALRKSNPEMSEQDLRRHVGLYTPQFFEAAKQQLAGLRNFRYQMAAAVAKEQQAIPGATLGPGAGSKEPPPEKLQPGTPEFQRAAIEMAKARMPGGVL